MTLISLRQCRSFACIAHQTLFPAKDMSKGVLVPRIWGPRFQENNHFSLKYNRAQTGARFPFELSGCYSTSGKRGWSDVDPFDNSRRGDDNGKNEQHSSNMSHTNENVEGLEFEVKCPKCHNYYHLRANLSIGSYTGCDSDSDSVGNPDSSKKLKVVKRTSNSDL